MAPNIFNLRTLFSAGKKDEKVDSKLTDKQREAGCEVGMNGADHAERDDSKRGKTSSCVTPRFVSRTFGRRKRSSKPQP